MKRVININQKDKEFFKMTNQSERGFDLIVASDSKLKLLLNTINNSEDEIHISWQQKFKNENYTLYRKCVFSKPEDNYFNKPGLYPKIVKCGSIIHVNCSGISYFTSNKTFINKKVRYSTHTYKDSKLLIRMLKIGELDSTENENNY
jgi:hypothetical protein